MSKTIIIDGIEYKKVVSLSIEDMMKEFDMTREEVILLTEEAAMSSNDMICHEGELYIKKD
jgi:hypothetical protein